VLTLAAAAILLASSACSPPGTGVGEQVEVFVVGDSWAALAGNPFSEPERELPYGLGYAPPAFGKLKGELGELRDPALPDRGRFNVVAYHPWGIPPSTTAG